MKKAVIILFIATLFAPFLGVNATIVPDNQPTVKAKFSPDTIMIGDQPVLTVTVTKDVSQKVFFPEFEKELMEGVEVLRQGEIDTVKVDGSRQMELTRRYLVTIFDAGDYTLNGFPVVHVDGERTDTLLSEPLSITVNTYAIDTTTQKIYDIKTPIDAPLQLAEIRDYIVIGLLALALIAIIIYIIIRLKYKDTMFARPKLPPHVIAVSELQKIKEMELWQHGKHKEYYTLLTDTLRDYLEGRFGKNAMEMTTDEIMSSIKEDVIGERDKEMLYELLSLADLVKFAKYIPDKEDNEIAFQRAYEFVEHTKSAEEAPETEGEEVAETVTEEKEEK